MQSQIRLSSFPHHLAIIRLRHTQLHLAKIEKKMNIYVLTEIKRAIYISPKDSGKFLEINLHEIELEGSAEVLECFRI